MRSTAFLYLWLYDIKNTEHFFKFLSEMVEIMKNAVGTSIIF